MPNDHPHLGTIRLHPIKALDGVSVSECQIGPGGGLAMDRVWAMFSADGQWVNGKNNAAVHRVRATYARDLSSVTLSVRDDELYPLQTFSFPDDFASAAEWFSEYFDEPVEVRHVPEGVPDDSDRNGPLLVSTASLRTVAEWFPAIDYEESRRRFRTPLEIDGVQSFWEDRLFNVMEVDTVPFTIGEVSFVGVNPCPRCVVPSRDTLTGAELREFQKRFATLRRETFPSWAAHPDRIRHFYHFGVNTRVAPSEHGKTLRVGDVLRLGGDVA